MRFSRSTIPPHGRLKIAGRGFSIVAGARLFLREVQALRVLLRRRHFGPVEAPSARRGHLVDTA